MKGRKKEDISSSNKLAVGISLGLLFGTLLNNLALGLCAGVLFGSLPNLKNKRKK